MFWPFASSCPVDEPTRQWLDKQLHWLSADLRWDAGMLFKQGMRWVGKQNPT